VVLVWSGEWFHVDLVAGRCHEWLICGYVWSGEWFCAAGVASGCYE
jgi:hypothetical protein